VGYTTGERDILRAADIKKLAKRISDPAAKRQALESAGRLERRGSKKLAQIGRKRRGTNRAKFRSIA